MVKALKLASKTTGVAYQDFVSVARAFSIQQGVVLKLQSMHNGHSSEIVTVQSLLDVLQLKGVCFTMDALHTQKKLSNASSIVAMIT